MSDIYSTYEAKARFSEILRKVRSGRRIRISYRGEVIAEIAPIEPAGQSLVVSLKRLEEAGVIGPAPVPAGPIRPIARKPGALARFLQSRH